MSTHPKGSTPGLIEPQNNKEKTETAHPTPDDYTVKTPQALPAPCLLTEQTLAEKGWTSPPSTENVTSKPPSQAEGTRPPSAASRASNEDPSSSTPPGEETTYPEGGLEAWLVVLGSFAGLIAAFGIMNSIGIFQAYISTHQLSEYSDSSVGWIFSMYTFLSFFCGIQIGPVFDAYGPFYLVMAGNILTILTMLLLGICKEYYQFMLVFGVLGGIGSSLLFTPAISAIGHFFQVKRGAATGLASCGGSIGGIIFPLMLQSLFPKVGFEWATRILGLLFILLCGTAQLFIKSRLPPKPGSSVFPDFRIFRDPAFALVTAGVFMMEWGLFIPITYLTSFALDTHAMSSSFSYQLIAIMNAGSSIGRWAPGYLADRFGRYNCMLAAQLLCFATTISFWLAASLLPTTETSSHNHTAVKALTVVYALLFGFASGSNISLTPVCVGQLCATEEYGRYYATCYTIVSFGTLTGIPIAGALLQATGGGYWGTIVFTGATYAVAFTCLLGARAVKVGWSLGIKY